MLPDPIEVDADSPNPAVSFAMIRTDGYGSERRDPGGVYAAKIQHSTGPSGDRHYVQVTQTIDATNPYNDAVSKQTASVSITLAKPAFGFTGADLANLYKLLADLLGTDTTLTDVIAFQS